MKYSFAFLGLAAIASAQEFTSIFNITASPDQVVNASSISTPGQPGAVGQFNYAINSKTETICYDITLTGVTGNYQSPARTATHIHEAAKGRNGPPRIAFPNPVGDDTVRRSVGCLTGPFTTGIKMADNVTDTGFGFKLSQIEANPAGFFTDSHTALFVPGVVRGQLNQTFVILPVGAPAGNGSVITTATLTKTSLVTITSCPPEKTECPYATKPLITSTVEIYTTVCPVSDLPKFTSAVATLSAPVTTKPAGTYPVPVPTTTTKPTETPATRTVVPASTTSRAVFTGAANANAIGGGVFVAGLAVAAFL